MTADTSKASRALSVAMPMKVGLIGVAVFVGGFGYWSGGTTIAGAVVASGHVTVMERRQVVQHLDGGIVASLNVREGEYVEQGDVLVRLDDTMLSTELSIIEGELFEIMARRARLEAERDGRTEAMPLALLAEAMHDDPSVEALWLGQVQLFEARRDTVLRHVEQYRKRQEQTVIQADGFIAQQDALQRQISLLEEEATAMETLFSRGLAEMPRILAMRREQAGQAGRLGEIEARRAELAGRVVEIDMEILSLQTERREQAISELRDIHRRETELLERRRAVLDRLGRLDIRAPVSGVIYDQQVFGPMAVIQPAQDVLHIVPQDRPLVVTARINPVHIDEVFVGQSVSLQFSALDQRTVPPLEGHVSRISPDVFEVQATGETYYQAEIAIEPQQLVALDGVRIVPGMPVEAFIRTRDRTPIEYLTQPLTDYFNRAFRES